jgi:pimeloyl-ACP methyl ester carboxylesterase
VLPVFGPSDNTAAPARVMDTAADPANYISALKPVGHATRLHQLSGIASSASGLMRTEPDSYALVRQAWPYLSRTTPPDWTPRTAPDLPTLESLGAAKVGPDDPLFAKRGHRRWVGIPGTGRQFPYQLWMQPRPAPLVFLSPGIGSHRLSGNTLALAEAMYARGFSVATMSGIFHPEFIGRASTAPMPGNPKRDRADVLAACTEIDADISHDFRRKITGRILAGFSLGGFATLQLAATEAAHAPGSVRFDHFLAIQCPVDLRDAYRILDGYFAIPATWPENGRATRLDNMFHKVAASLNHKSPIGGPPFDGDESRTLVGYSFRLVLRDALYSIHDKAPSARVRSSHSTWRRETLYQELMALTYEDYFHDWLRPEERRLGLSNNGLLRKTTLRTAEKQLRGHQRVHVIGNRNDFLLSEADREWMSATFGDRAIWLPSGGHLGNLKDPQFLQALDSALDGLR